MKELDLNLNEFRQFIVSRKIICYGCGSSGVRAINIMENWGVEKDILTFVDSDPRKWGKHIENGSVSYSIVSLDDAVEIADGDTIFLITCVSDVLKIRNLLNHYDKLENLYCFSLVELAQYQLLCSDYDEIVHESSSILIPKRIHYAWFGGSMPERIKYMIDSWREMCPDYEIIEWNETNYDIAKCKYMRQAYEAKQWAFVPDYARCDIIYNHGGIYLDIDVKIEKNLDDLLYQKNFFISDVSFMVNLGAGFGAQKGEPVLKDFMEYYDTVDFKLEDGSLNKKGCVFYQYKVLKDYGMKINDTFQVINGVNVYPMIMGGTNSYSMQKRVTAKTYLAHYGSGGWSHLTPENRIEMQEHFKDSGLENYSWL
ncbi:MAG: hypothetical protein HDR28_05565 [Lachnospiraceae bacterium]|nr:hypothetical protein [Lachnospiraceae bacterium]